MITVTGHSDDIIAISGDLNEEFPYNGNDGKGDLLAFSDGTLLRIQFDRDGDGTWRITPLRSGAAGLAVDQHVGEDGTDTATLDGSGIRWAVHGSSFAKAGR